MIAFGKAWRRSDNQEQKSHGKSLSKGRCEDHWSLQPCEATLGKSHLTPVQHEVLFAVASYGGLLVARLESQHLFAMSCARGAVSSPCREGRLCVACPTGKKPLFKVFEEAASARQADLLLQASVGAAGSCSRSAGRGREGQMGAVFSQRLQLELARPLLSCCRRCSASCSWRSGMPCGMPCEMLGYVECYVECPYALSETM